MTATSRQTVRAILAGMTLDARTEVRCSHCGAHLEGTDVELVARKVGPAGWHIVTVYDAGCGPDEAPETPFGPSVLATARPGLLADVLDQSHTPALLDVKIVDAALGREVEGLHG